MHKLPALRGNGSFMCVLAFVAIQYELWARIFHRMQAPWVGIAYWGGEGQQHRPLTPSQVRRFGFSLALLWPTPLSACFSQAAVVSGRLDGMAEREERLNRGELHGSLLLYGYPLRDSSCWAGLSAGSRPTPSHRKDVGKQLIGNTFAAVSPGQTGCMECRCSGKAMREAGRHVATPRHRVSLASTVSSASCLRRSQPQL